MTRIAVRSVSSDELTKIERHEAWLEYLEAVRPAPPDRYDQVEVWAWARLLAKLDRLKARRAA